MAAKKKAKTITRYRDRKPARRSSRRRNGGGSKAARMKWPLLAAGGFGYLEKQGREDKEAMIHKVPVVMEEVGPAATVALAAYFLGDGPMWEGVAVGVGSVAAYKFTSADDKKSEGDDDSYTEGEFDTTTG